MIHDDFNLKIPDDVSEYIKNNANEIFDSGMSYYVNIPIDDNC